MTQDELSRIEVLLADLERLRDRAQDRTDPGERQSKFYAGVNAGFAVAADYVRAAIADLTGE